MANVAYFAGLFDGEGCVATRNRHPYYNVFPQVAMTDPRPLTALQEAFGGTIRPVTSGRGRWKTEKQQWRWNITNKQGAREFFEAILPHSLVKSDQISKALELLSLIKGRGAPLRNHVGSKNVKERMRLVSDIRLDKRRSFTEEAV